MARSAVKTWATKKVYARIQLIWNKGSAHGDGYVNAGFINERKISSRVRSRTFESRAASHGPPHEPNVLAGLERGVFPILTPAAAALAQVHAVRGPQAHTRMGGGLDKGLHQSRTVAEAKLEISTQPPQHPSQLVRGEIATSHAGAHEKPTQGHHPMAMGAALGCVPTDPLVARGKLQGPRARAHGPEPAMRRAHQIAQLTAPQWARPARVLAGHELVPHRPVMGILDPRQHQSADLTELGGNRLGRRHGLAQASRPRHPGPVRSVPAARCAERNRSRAAPSNSRCAPDSHAHRRTGTPRRPAPSGPRNAGPCRHAPTLAAALAARARAACA